MDNSEYSDDRHGLVYNDAFNKVIDYFAEVMVFIRYDSDFVTLIADRLDLSVTDKDGPYIVKAIEDVSRYALNVLIGNWQAAKKSVVSDANSNSDVIADIDAGVEDIPE